MSCHSKVTKERTMCIIPGVYCNKPVHWSRANILHVKLLCDITVIYHFMNRNNRHVIKQIKCRYTQERLKRRNTLGCLDQYAAQNGKYAKPPIPSQPQRSSSSGTLNMIPLWNIQTVKQSMTRSCSNGCSLNWFTPSEFFQFSQLSN